MTDLSNKKQTIDSCGQLRTIDIVNRGLKQRYRWEKRFKRAGLLAVVLSLGFLGLLFGNMLSGGWQAFRQTTITLDVYLDRDVLNADTMANADYALLLKNTLYTEFPDVTARADKRGLFALLSTNASYQIREYVLRHPQAAGSTVTFKLLAASTVDMYRKSGGSYASQLSPRQLEWIGVLQDNGKLKTGFSLNFLTRGDSREAEQAGILGALMGSLFTMVVTLLIAFPVGVAAAIYLEELAPQNRLTDIIEVNINNLAAVPSIIFGLLGLAVFLNVFGLPRSAPLVGGFVLSLMTMPTIIIASRSALKAVPPSIREAALGIGASRMQTIFHHVVPLAMPGMLTGSIIGMARALGETAPLLMIGMVAFIVDIPQGVSEPATALPVQIYLWADSPERGFVEKTAAATLVLVLFMLLINAAAIFLRKKFERKW